MGYEIRLDRQADGSWIASLAGLSGGRVVEAPHPMALGAAAEWALREAIEHDGIGCGVGPPDGRPGTEGASTIYRMKGSAAVAVEAGEE